MTKAHISGVPWLVFELNQRRFAVTIDQLQQILPLPNIVAVPGQRDFVRGVINIRGKVLPLVDLRRRLGMTSALADIENFSRLMDAREADHRLWLDELQRSIEERREFQLATDPHQCAFGKWYDAYRVDDPWISALLKRLDDPHQRIHALAEQVRACSRDQRYDEAIRIVTGNGANSLALMIDLFRTLKKLVRDNAREIVLLLTTEKQTIAATADSVVAIEKFDAQELPSGGSGATIRFSAASANSHNKGAFQCWLTRTGC